MHDEISYSDEEYELKIVDAFEPKLPVIQLSEPSFYA